MNLLERLKRRLNLEDSGQEPLLHDLLTDAERYVAAYTGRDRAPAVLTAAVVELAAGSYGRLGLEGVRSHGEGALSDSYEGLPEHLRQLLDLYRLAKVGCP